MSLDIALVCRPQLLRLGLERVLDEAGHEVQSHCEPFFPPRPAAVGIVCEREAGDLEAVCAGALGTLAGRLVVVFRSPVPELVLGVLDTGVRGFVAEQDQARELLLATTAAAADEYHVAPAVLGPLLDWHRFSRQPRAERTRARDRDLLGLLAAGETTASIAERLGLAPKTVRNRSSLLYRRLGVRSRGQAAQIAEERGLLDRTTNDGGDEWTREE